MAPNQSILFTTNEELCIDKDKCEKVDDIYVLSEVESCTEELLIQYGNDKQAYLTSDGQLKSSPTSSECANAYKSIKYALKNIIIDVIKHKNSVLVKSYKTENDKSSHLGLSRYINDKFDDFLQYVLIVLSLLGQVLTTIVIIYKIMFQKRIIER